MAEPALICPDFLSTGTCSDLENCQLDHEVPTCETCALTFVTEKLYQFHINSRKHFRNTQGEGAPVRVRCEPCGKAFALPLWDSHVTGRPHKGACQRKGVEPASVEPIETDDPPPNHQYCPTCDTCVPDIAWQLHVNSVQHTSRLRFSAHEAAMDEAFKDKNGVVVNGMLDFGILPPTHSGQSLSLAVKSLLPLSKTKLVKFELASGRRGKSSYVLLYLVVRL